MSYETFRRPPLWPGSHREQAVIIPLLIDGYEDTRERFAKRGIRLDLQIPGEPGEKTGVRLDAWSGRGLAQLLLWDTGELDLTVGDANTGDILLDEQPRCDVAAWH